MPYNHQDLVLKLGLKLKRSGTNYVMLCPFHDEKTPSCVVYNNGIKCFGCGRKTDGIGLIMHLKNADFPTAKSQVEQLMGVSNATNTQAMHAPKRLISNSIATHCSVYTMFADLCKTHTPKALKKQCLDYLQGRGITTSQIAKSGLFVASKEAFEALQCCFTENELIASGLLSSEKKFFMLTNNPLCVPLRNPISGKIYGAQGRRIDSEKERKYVICSPKDLPFNIYFTHIIKGQATHGLLVAEGYFDLLHFVHDFDCIALTGLTKSLDFDLYAIEGNTNLDGVSRKNITHATWFITDYLKGADDLSKWQSIKNAFTSCHPKSAQVSIVSAEFSPENTDINALFLHDKEAFERFKEKIYLPF